MRKGISKVSPLVWSMYTVMLLLAFVLVMISVRKYKIVSPVELQYRDTISFIDGWLDEEGKEVDLVNLYQKNTIVGEEKWIHRDIPNEIKEGYTLNISAKNVYYQLFVDNRLLPDVYNSDEQKVKNFFGRRYSMIPIEKSMAGKTIVMKLALVYQDKSSTFLNITLGLPQGHLLHTIREKIIAIVTCIIFIFLSLLLILVDIPINMRNEKNHELLALGLLSFIVGVWGLMSTHIIEYFTGNGRTTQITACLFLPLLGIPLFIYVRYSMGLLSDSVLNIYTAISFLEFLVVWILELTDTVDVQLTLKFTHIILAVAFFFVVLLIISKKEKEDKSKDCVVYHLYRILGVVSIILGAVIDLYRYYYKNDEDSAIFIRIGLLFFIICFGASSLEKTIHAVKAGERAEFISQLAYRDGLTNLSNRTAFNERLEALFMKQDNVALIMFDVNDLKYVNDHLGHQYGDEMLVNSAALISRSLGTIGGECYRIGGDEFVVILCKECIKEAVTDGMQMFKRYVKEYNAQKNLNYHIQIAYGYALSEKEKCDINHLYEIADLRMYECKKKMKESGRQLE